MTSRIICADVLSGLAQIESGSVQCCVTSPPYWGLRDYGTAKWEGGDAECDHAQEPPRFNGPKQTAAQVSGHASKAESHDRRACPKCGARRIDAQIGLEPTPEAYVAKMVAVFEEVRRVLRKDGTLWLNLGDSYAAQRGGTQMPAETLAGGVGGHSEEIEAYRGRRSNDGADWMGREAGAANKARVAHRNASRIGLKHKDLVGIPWRIAFALQSAGWYLRSDIIWSKPNPMPESVTDRPTKAHEYVFLLSKSPRYFYDAEAIAEPAMPFGMTRNARSVWTIATQPFPEAHFATFPLELPRRCILAGSRKGDTVLDPFAGSGTVGVVCEELKRDFVGVELNPMYAEMAERRIAASRPPTLADLEKRAKHEAQSVPMPLFSQGG